jgi:serine/threonine-protein kinase
MTLELAPGAVVAGRYRLDRLLGRGGMGQVWAVTHEITQRTAALKLLNGPVDSRPDRRRRFLREARAASSIHHPNVVTIHDFFELDDGTPVMLMDLLEGETFGARLNRDGPLSLRDTVDVLLPVVSAVGTAHAVGVIHRDLKPENVFLARSPGGGLDVRVLDFGVAKLSAAAEQAMNESAACTDTGALVGTPYYMSPEQCFGEAEVDHRTDIWSIGVMLYEALSGVRPIDGENVRRVLSRLLGEAITPIEVLVPNLPAPVVSLIGAMLSRDPTLRPRDLREVQSVLEPHATVTVQPFDAATAERQVPLDSNPSSGRAGARAVVAVEGTSDPEAATFEDVPVRPYRLPPSDRAPPATAPSPAPRRALGPWLVGAAVAFALAGVVVRHFASPPVAAKPPTSVTAPPREAPPSVAVSPGPLEHAEPDPSPPVATSSSVRAPARVVRDHRPRTAAAPSSEHAPAPPPGLVDEPPF